MTAGRKAYVHACLLSQLTVHRRSPVLRGNYRTDKAFIHRSPTKGTSVPYWRLWNSMARVWGTIERAWIMCKVRKWGWGKKKGEEKWKFLEKWKSGHLKEFVMVRVSTIWQKDKNMNKNKRKNLILILTHRMMYMYITIYLQINRAVENVHMV